MVAVPDRVRRFDQVHGLTHPASEVEMPLMGAGRRVSTWHPWCVEGGPEHTTLTFSVSQRPTTSRSRRRRVIPVARPRRELPGSEGAPLEGFSQNLSCHVRSLLGAGLCSLRPPKALRPPTPCLAGHLLDLASSHLSNLQPRSLPDRSPTRPHATQPPPQAAPAAYRTGEVTTDRGERKIRRGVTF